MNYKDVKKLRPGHLLIFRNGQYRMKAYFKPQFCPQEDFTDEDWIGRINETLSTILSEDESNFRGSECISFLSGGVDSSYLLAMSGVKRVCCIGYDDEQCSETGPASFAAARLGAQFNELRVTSDDYFAAIPGFLKSTGLPLADTASLAFSIGYKRLSARARLILSGMILYSVAEGDR